MQSTCSKHGTPVSISTRTHFSTVQITTIVVKQFNFYWHEKSCVNMETDFLALHTAPIQDESKGSKSDRSSPCISPSTLGRVSIQCLSFVLEAFAFLFQATESYTYLPIIWMCSAFNICGLNIWFDRLPWIPGPGAIPCPSSGSSKRFSLSPACVSCVDWPCIASKNSTTYSLLTLSQKLQQLTHNLLA